MRSGNVKKFVKNVRLDTDTNVNRKFFSNVVEAFEKSKAREEALKKLNIWRKIMKSNISKLAAAALIILACSISLVFWKSTGSGIALAEVLTRIEQVTGYTYQIESRSIRKQTAETRTSNVLVSKKYGIKMTIIRTDPNSQPKYNTGDEWYFLIQSNSIVIVSHKEKTYDRFIYDDVELDFYKERYNEPRAIIKQILSCEHKSLGQSAIDGITVEGFKTTDLSYGGGFFGEASRSEENRKVDITLWVDLNTFLPVRLEQDIVTKNGTQLHEVSYDFKWNVIINQDYFVPEIPEDYRAPAGDIIIKPPNEENAILGLKLFVNATGKYPENLDLKVFTEEYKRLFPPDPNSYDDLSDEERTQKTNEGLSFAGPAFFYGTLVEKGKEPVYYGDKVGTNDSDKILLRWKWRKAPKRGPGGAHLRAVKSA
jgi:outer membrane lipoprotein-sorting protein